MVGFERIDPIEGPSKFKCVICGSRSGSRLENVRKHLASRGHKMKLAELNKISQNAVYQELSGIKMEINTIVHDDHNILFDDHIFNPIQEDVLLHPDQQEIFLSTVDLNEFNCGREYSGPEQDTEIDMTLEELFNMISGGLAEDSVGSGMVSAQTRPQDSLLLSEWYPFPSKEVCACLPFIFFFGVLFSHCTINGNYYWSVEICGSYLFPFKYVVSALLLGHLHSIISRSSYDRVRALFTTYHVALPHWVTIRRTREYLRGILDLEIRENLSVLGNKTFNIGLKKLIGNVSSMIPDLYEFI